MTTTREQLEAHWKDSANWKAGCIYNCPEDPRIVVHKRTKWMGYTMNFAHTGAYVALGLIIALLTAPALAFLFMPPHPAGITMAVLQIALIAPLIYYCHWETNRYQ